MHAASIVDRALILVVDDALPVRLLVARALTDAGYDVITAGDGLAAVELIQAFRTPPDLVIADLLMPVMGGVQLAHWLEQHFPRLPVMFISGYAFALGTEHAGRLLAKPFTPDQVVALAREALPGRPRTTGPALLLDTPTRAVSPLQLPMS